MNFDKTVQCLLGNHDWAYRYVRPNSCDAQLICNRCHKVKGSVKVVHQQLKKEYVNEGSCELRCVCSRCQATIGNLVTVHSVKKTYIHEKSCEIRDVCFRCKSVLGNPEIKHKWGWAQINPCTQQQTCKRCGVVGEIRESEHTWKELYLHSDNCETFAVCERCGKRHDSVGYVVHDWEWIQVNPCYQQKTCKHCGLIDGSKELKHKWKEVYSYSGRCETQIICEQCGKFGGSRGVVHDWDYQFFDSNPCIKHQICKRCHTVGGSDDSGQKKWGGFCSDKEKKAHYTIVQKAVRDIGFSMGLWYIAERKPEWDIKRQTRNQIVRTVASVTQSTLPSTNISIYSIYFATATSSERSSDEQCLVFYPNAVAVLQGRSPEQNRYEVASALYPEIKVVFSKVKFMENETVPGDSKIIAHDWEHIRVDGGPDRRYSDNKKLPIVSYGLVEIALRQNLVYQFYVSNLAHGQKMVEVLTNYIELHKPFNQTHGKSQSSENAHRSSSENKKQSSNLEGKSPYEILGVSKNATLQEITKAYRELARRNHPDRVADMSTVIRTTANAQMKLINAAYEELKKKHR